MSEKSGDVTSERKMKLAIEGHAYAFLKNGNRNEKDERLTMLVTPGERIRLTRRPDCQQMVK